MTDATVRLWGRDIGAVSWLDDRAIGVFQYMPEFARSSIELAPIMMPRSPDPYEFPGLPRDAFKGLPGMLADSLPDKFGNALIDAWLATQGRSAGSFDPVERLCYIGTRGMGALEFHPAILRGARQSRRLEIDALTRLANDVLNDRARLGGILEGEDDHETLQEILRVGTSAGGARAKAILAWNEKTGEFRSGQVKAGEGFTYWLMTYEQAVETIRLLGLPAHDIEQQFRRAVFNVLVRNQDDHVKNIAFLMNRQGEWRLSPAFDVSYAYNPDGSWTHQHQMSLSGKRDHFVLSDLVAFGVFCDLKPRKAEDIVREIHAHVENWPDFAQRAGVAEKTARAIHRAMRREMIIPA
ncbi:MAG: HipA domain-containing protein [Pseudomonadota bacterium]|nr:HipA domain-containing protein [Pseudomonadota bacterium]